jgi:hypothetical protein
VTISSRKHRLYVVVIRPGQTTPLGDWPLPLAYGPNEWFHLELRARGEDLTVSLDGQVLGTVRDGSVTAAGMARIFVSAHGYFRDIVYGPLDPPAR